MWVRPILLIYLNKKICHPRIFPTHFIHFLLLWNPGTSDLTCCIFVDTQWVDGSCSKNVEHIPTTVSRVVSAKLVFRFQSNLFRFNFVNYKFYNYQVILYCCYCLFHKFSIIFDVRYYLCIWLKADEITVSERQNK